MTIKDIKWTDDLSVNVEFLDDDHKKLVNILSSLFVAGFVGAGDEMVEQTLKELEDYTLYHFEREEKYLEQHGYPLLESHKQEHRKLIQELNNYTQMIRDNGATGTNTEVMLFLRTWLFNHIRGHDQHYAAFLEKQA